MKRSKQVKCFFGLAMVDFNGIKVKLFFCKTSRKGKWNVLMTTKLELTFEQA